MENGQQNQHCGPYREGEQPVPGYRLLKLIGEGSFGQVWRATGPGGVAVALKVVPLLDSSNAGSKTDPSFNKAAIKEIRAMELMRSMKHPYLAEIYGYWLKTSTGRLIDDGDHGSASEPSVASHADPRGRHGVRRASFLFRLFSEGANESWENHDLQAAELLIAMTLGEGTLHDLLEFHNKPNLPVRKGIPVEELLKFMQHTAEALDWLNTPGPGKEAMIHCDVKPRNILTVGQYARVCDFGLTRIFRHDLSLSQQVGTPIYAPLELLGDSDASDIDDFSGNKISGPKPSTDQYSLAITFYELRTGTFPYPKQVLEQINTGSPLAFIKVVKCNYEEAFDFSAVSAAEADVLRRATRRDYRKRWGSCSELVEQLKKALQPNASAEQPVLTVAPVGNIEHAPAVASTSPPPWRRLGPYDAGDQPLEGFFLEKKFADDGPGELWQAVNPGGVLVSMRIVALPATTFDANQPHPATSDFSILRRLCNTKHPALAEVQGLWLKDTDGGLLPVKEVLDTLSGSMKAPMGTLRPSAELLVVMTLGEETLRDFVPAHAAGSIDSARRLDVNDLLNYLQDAAEALDFLNGLRPAIVHGEIKPDDILLVGGRARLGNFGLSQLRGSRVSAVALKNHHMFSPPELLRGQAGVNERNNGSGVPRPHSNSDQYSLAITYYLLRTGRFPYFDRLEHGDSLRSVALDKHSELLELSGVTEPEIAVLRQALRADPKRRWPNCRAFIDAIRVAVFKAAEDQSAYQARGPYRPGSCPLPGYRVTEVLGQKDDAELLRATTTGGKAVRLVVMFFPPPPDPSESIDGMTLEDRATEEWERLKRLTSVSHPNLNVPEAWIKNESGKTYSAATFGRSDSTPALVSTIVGGQIQAPANNPRELLIALTPGRSLAEDFSEGKLPEPSALMDGFRQLAKLLDFLNDRGIWHLDVHPGNIYFKDGQCSLALARFQGSSQNDQSTEQLIEDEFYRPLPGSDINADQFALAVTFYRLLTGRWPYPASVTQEQDASQALERLSQAKKHGQFDLTHLDSRAARAVKRALAPDPTRRWPNCDVFVDRATRRGSSFLRWLAVACVLALAGVAAAGTHASFFPWQMPGFGNGIAEDGNQSPYQFGNGTDTQPPPPVSSEAVPSTDPATSQFAKFEQLLAEKRFRDALVKLNQLWNEDDDGCRERLDRLIRHWKPERQQRWKSDFQSYKTKVEEILDPATHDDFPQLGTDKLWGPRVRRVSSAHREIKDYWTTVVQDLKKAGDKHFHSPQVSGTRPDPSEAKRYYEVLKEHSEYLGGFFQDAGAMAVDIERKLLRIDLYERGITPSADDVKNLREQWNRLSLPSGSSLGNEDPNRHKTLETLFLDAALHKDRFVPLHQKTTIHEYWNVVLKASHANLQAARQASASGDELLGGLIKSEQDLLDKQRNDYDDLLATSAIDHGGMEESRSQRDRLPVSILPALPELLPELYLRCQLNEFRIKLQDAKQPAPDIARLTRPADQDSTSPRFKRYELFYQTLFHRVGDKKDCHLKNALNTWRDATWRDLGDDAWDRWNTPLATRIAQIANDQASDEQLVAILEALVAEQNAPQKTTRRQENIIEMARVAIQRFTNNLLERLPANPQAVDMVSETLLKTQENLLVDGLGQNLAVQSELIKLLRQECELIKKFPRMQLVVKRQPAGQSSDINLPGIEPRALEGYRLFIKFVSRFLSGDKQDEKSLVEDLANLKKLWSKEAQGVAKWRTPEREERLAYVLHNLAKLWFPNDNNIKTERFSPIPLLLLEASHTIDKESTDIEWRPSLLWTHFIYRCTDEELKERTQFKNSFEVLKNYFQDKEAAIDREMKVPVAGRVDDGRTLVCELARATYWATRESALDPQLLVVLNRLGYRNEVTLKPVSPRTAQEGLAFIDFVYNPLRPRIEKPIKGEAGETKLGIAVVHCIAAEIGYRFGLSMRQGEPSYELAVRECGNPETLAENLKEPTRQLKNYAAALRIVLTYFQSDTDPGFTNERIEHAGKNTTAIENLAASIVFLLQSRREMRMRNREAASRNLIQVRDLIEKRKAGEVDEKVAMWLILSECHTIESDLLGGPIDSDLTTGRAAHLVEAQRLANQAHKTPGLWQNSPVLAYRAAVVCLLRDRELAEISLGQPVGLWEAYEKVVKDIQSNLENVRQLGNVEKATVDLLIVDFQIRRLLAEDINQKFINRIAQDEGVDFENRRDELDRHLKTLRSLSTALVADKQTTHLSPAVLRLYHLLAVRADRGLFPPGKEPPADANREKLFTDAIRKELFAEAIRIAREAIGDKREMDTDSLLDMFECIHGLPSVEELDAERLAVVKRILDKVSKKIGGEPLETQQKATDLVIASDRSEELKEYAKRPKEPELSHEAQVVYELRSWRRNRGQQGGGLLKVDNLPVLFGFAKRRPEILDEFQINDFEHEAGMKNLATALKACQDVRRKMLTLNDIKEAAGAIGLQQGFQAVSNLSGQRLKLAWDRCIKKEVMILRRINLQGEQVQLDGDLVTILRFYLLEKENWWVNHDFNNVKEIQMFLNKFVK